MKLLLIFLCLAAGRVFAQGEYRLSGNADLTRIGTETPDGSGTSLSQRYALNLQRSFTPLLSANGSIRYYHLGQDFEAGRSFQSELQPMGQLAWNAPWFSLGAYGQKSLSETSAAGADMTRENGSINLKTKSEKYPLLSLRYDAARMYTPDSMQIRNIREDRFLAGAGWQVGNHNLSYQGNRQRTENLNRSTIQYGTGHSFRWDQNDHFLDRRLRFRSEYVLNYRVEEFEKPDSIPAIRQVPFRKAYAAVDRSPQFSTLDTVEGLSDGNRTAPLQPGILLGPEHTDINIALDFERLTDAGILYVYTNAGARTGGSWAIYASNPPFINDGMEWAPVIGGVESRYDEGYLRYEITFRNAGARFLKLVYAGSTDTGTVDVTEIEVFRREPGSDANRFESSSQIISLNSTYRLSEKYDVSMDLGMRNEPIAPAGVKKK